MPPATAAAAARRAHLAWSTLLVAPVLLFAERAWARRWMSDDGFINLRVVHHLLEGHGPVFNVGERVEAYTSALWVGLLALLGATGLSLERLAVWGGVVLSVSGLALALGAASVLHGAVPWRAASLERARLVPLGATIYAVLPPAWDHASAGLETGLSLCWLGASFALMVRFAVRVESGESVSPRALGATAFWLGLGPLVRPELALFALGMLAVLAAHVASERRWRRLLWLAWAAGLVPIAHQIFRMGWFATTTPNTALAKEAFEARWDQGWRYFDNFFGLYALLVPLAIALLLAVAPLEQLLRARRWRRVAVCTVPLCAGVAYAVYVVRVGGGFMHGRLFLPAVFCFLMPLAAVPLRERPDLAPATWRRVAVALVAAWCIAVLGWTRVERDNEHGIGDERGWYAREAKRANPVRLDDFRELHFHKDAHYLLDRAAEHCQGGGRDAVLAGDTGACLRFVFVDTVGYGKLDPHTTHVPLDPQRVGDGVIMVVQRVAIGVAGRVVGPTVHQVDHVGLADPLAARMELAERGRPGHEKALSNAWLVARFAAADAPASADPQVAAARRALACGELAELMDAVTAPMTAERFVENLVRAPRLTRLRIPVDPHEAERRFCGTR